MKRARSPATGSGERNRVVSCCCNRLGTVTEPRRETDDEVVSASGSARWCLPAMFELEFTESALEDLRSLRKTEQSLVLDEIEQRLPAEPLTASKKTVDLSSQILTLDALLELASEENILVRTVEGREYLLAEVEDLDSEVELIRRNQELMEFLDQRSRETKTYTLAQVREILA